MKEHLNIINSVFTIVFILAFQTIGYSQINANQEKRCLVYGENSFKFSDDYLTKNSAMQFFLKIGEKEFPMDKNMANSRLTANLPFSNFPATDNQKTLQGKIIGKLGSVEKASSAIFIFSAVKSLDWEVIEKGWDDIPIYFENGKIGIQPRRAKHNANAADNNAHCLESVLFADADGDFQILKVGDAGLKKVGKFGIVNLEFTNPKLSLGNGKLIIKHFGNPVTQEIKVRLYEKPPTKVEINLSSNNKIGTITTDQSQRIETPNDSSITYCPKGYFAKKEREHLRWEMGLDVCKERPVRLNGDRKRFIDYARTDKMTANSDSTAVFNLKLTDGRVFKYLFTMQD